MYTYIVPAAEFQMFIIDVPSKGETGMK